ncbi:DNA-directed RNA polymerase specialized sigma subunit, sigma24 family [Actinacidiphila yanglinensis]|uniref:DNA-directed RNA polymerase specialized sigma subunit, sigma24 family n=1 Tax=Actinacidiphila yanglinensis TaxID=310779 RepID=A0A1H6BPH1_9ACTN|nr:hypothetical protein [Actinacidiphila yanglinensis]SEG62532.1 DNA-directed RNA polymerase specialized sigma subunit, sigma24 family [Actinacidiphila yanglinensis]
MSSRRRSRKRSTAGGTARTPRPPRAPRTPGASGSPAAPTALADPAGARPAAPSAAGHAPATAGHPRTTAAPGAATLVAATAPTSIGAPTRTATEAPAPAAPDATTAPSPAPAPAPADATAAPAPAPARTPPPALALGLPDDATPENAFDALYTHAAGPLLHQVELLTGDTVRARQSVAHAFDLAWQRWEEVAQDSDPVGWVRATAYEHALAPWQRWVPSWAGGHRPRPRIPADPLAAALLTLPPVRRKAVLLHDGLGLDLPATAAEAEAGEEAAAARIAGAREALTEAVPDLSAEALPVRLGALLDGGAGTEPEPPDRPEGVRDASRRGARRRTFGAYALTAAIAVATTAAVILTPAHQSSRRPVRPGPAATVHAPARTGGQGSP